MSAYLISCGGTGGHLSPGIALAEGLAERGHTATLLISQKRVDARLIEKYPNLHFVPIPAAPFTLQPSGLVRFLVLQLKGFFVSRKLIRTLRPVCIVGFGGFTTGAIIMAGKLRGVTVVLHEANRVPGRAIRSLSRFARRMYLPPGVDLSGVKPGVVRNVGLPVRREILRLPRQEACARIGLNPSQKILAIFGGSQGATVLNEWARRELPGLAKEGVQLYCVTGQGKGAGEVVSLQAADHSAVTAKFVPFCDEVAALLSAADLVVARAGAGSIAEMIRCGTPSVVIPYPHAADDHQRANARWLESHQAAVVMNQDVLDSDLAGTVRALIFDEARLASMRHHLKKIDQGSPLSSILDDLELLNPSGKTTA